MTFTPVTPPAMSGAETLRPVLEVGVYDIDSALAAYEGGADRIELCANLPQGGISPSQGVIEVVRAEVPIGLWVMIRPRPYDFCYSRHDFAAMHGDIAVAKKLGADGVVLGILKPDGRVDIARTRELVKAAAPMQVTFHRAFDMTPDLPQALDDLMETGVTRVLTTGEKDDSLDGLQMISQLIDRAADRLGILVGRTDETTIARVIQGCGAKEIHLNARRNRPGLMRYLKTEPRMGTDMDEEYAWPVTDASRVAKAVEAARNHGGECV